MSDPTEAIDYSRPVGWWCPVCTRYAQMDRADDLIKLGLLSCCRATPYTPVIPWFIPIPEGQRPLVEDEAESAEVVTFTIPGTADPAWCAPPGWTTFHDTAEEIYEIVVGINLWAKGATE